MKSSKGKSVSDMQAELKKENDGGQHLFTGILSAVERNGAASVIVPMPSDTDFSFAQYQQAEPLMMERLRKSDRPLRHLSNASACANGGEFLTTVSGLLNAAIAGKGAPQSRCYIYDAQLNTLTLERLSPVRELVVRVNGVHGGTIVEKAYHDLLEADFVSEHELTKKRVHFTIVAGMQGHLQAVPVQIRYQPNWWFQVVLNLKAADSVMAEAMPR